MNAPPSRFGDWMQTASGKMFWPLDPRADEVDIHDIAHALANLCRYGGHCRRFYSVAEHSVLMARAVDAPWKLWALLHDAAEAYVVDVPRPLKRFLVGYRETEDRVLRCIVDKFGLRYNDTVLGTIIPDNIGIVDNRILLDEKAQNMVAGPAWGSLDGYEPLGVTLQFWTPEQAEGHFLDLFAELTVGA